MDDTAPASCNKDGHDLVEDASRCRRCGMVAEAGFRLGTRPFVMLAGPMLCPVDVEDNELGGYRAEHHLRRPLQLGEKVCTLGPIGDWRSGTVVSVESPTVDDGSMYWWPEFDKDERHGWTVRSFALKTMTVVDDLAERKEHGRQRLLAKGYREDEICWEHVPQLGAFVPVAHLTDAQNARAAQHHEKLRQGAWFVTLEGMERRLKERA